MAVEQQLVSPLKAPSFQEQEPCSSGSSSNKNNDAAAAAAAAAAATAVAAALETAVLTAMPIARAYNSMLLWRPRVGGIH